MNTSNVSGIDRDSGGACLGAAQAGMLKALYEREIRPDFLVAASVGAINTAFAASRPATVATDLGAANHAVPDSRYQAGFRP